MWWAHGGARGTETSIPDFCEKPLLAALTIFMPRIARVVAVGLPHHVTQRGNNRQRVFDSDRDRLLYLRLLREYSARHGLQIWGFCLMDNHIHLIAVPNKSESLARTLRQTHADYARYVNLMRQTSGHLWQNRYFSCALDASHCWQALAYVERNPVRAGMVSDPADWLWSSARAHAGEVDAVYPLHLSDWRKAFTANQWRKVLLTTVAQEAQAERIREASRTGRPLGENTFLREIERRLKRRLTPGKPGPRPGA